MIDSELKAMELIADAIETLIEKYQKKVSKEKAKANKSYITYQGDKYYSEKDLMDAYACDIFSSATYDKLREKLHNIQSGTESESENESILAELTKYQNQLLFEVDMEKWNVEQEHKLEKRIQELTDQGYSITEAEEIIEKEEMELLSK